MLLFDTACQNIGVYFCRGFMKKVLFTLLLARLIGPPGCFAQVTNPVEVYIDKYKELAVKEMKVYHIPASITLAQGLLESNNGQSPLATEANNHFGIKCHKEWTGRTFYQDDDEKDECFRKYKDPAESFRDHSEFLSTRDRYRFLFDLDITDYRGWAYGLKKAGYATNPRYPELLIRIIEENGLEKYDKMSPKDLEADNQSKQEHQPKPKPNTKNQEISASPPTVFEFSGMGGNDRVIFVNNGVKFILARKGDDFSKIAGEFEIYTWQIRKYNELDRDGQLVSGEKVYLEKKKRKSAYSTHLVREGEDLREISQDYGIRLKVICRLNRLEPRDTLQAGETIRLK